RVAFPHDPPGERSFGPDRAPSAHGRSRAEGRSRMKTVTVLGGGQLGLMLGLAGIPLGVSFRFLDPSPDAPARAVGDLVVGGLDDVAAASKAADGAAVVTYEWEGVPAETARALAAEAPVHPSARALEASQDRVHEKTLLQGLCVATAPFRPVDDRAA